MHDEETAKAIRVGPRAEVIAPGSRIAGRYRVVRLLGRGGMGAVFEAEHEGLGERVAIKLLLADDARSAEARARFVREARAAAAIKSEHVVRVLDVGETQDASPYIAMEYLEGRDLGVVLAEDGPLDVGDLASFLVQACEVLAEAHRAGVVHRDLKPSNLFLARRPDGSAALKVLDFGIAKAPSDEPALRSLTDTREVFGSPAYMSPEQVRSAKRVDARSDIWSLGVIAYELLSGRMPFDGESSAAIIAAIASDPPVSLDRVRPGLPPELVAVIHRCLEKDPARRFGSAADLAAALQPWVRPSTLVHVRRAQRLSSVAPPAATSSAPGARGTVIDVATTVPAAEARPAGHATTLWVLAAGAGVALAVAALVLRGAVVPDDRGLPRAEVDAAPASLPPQQPPVEPAPPPTGTSEPPTAPAVPPARKRKPSPPVATPTPSTAPQVRTEATGTRPAVGPNLDERE